MTQPDPQIDPAEQLELKLPGEAKSWREIAMWAGVLALLVLVPYWPSTSGQFLPRDQIVTGYDQRLLLRPGGLGTAWSTPVGRYTPVAFTAQWIAYRLGGADANNVPAPMAFHVAGVVFLTVAAVLVWFVLRELSVAGSWVIAAAAAVHPLTAAAGASVADQNLALAAALGWGSIYLYLLFVKNREATAAQTADEPPIDPAQTWGFYAGSVACAWLGALSSPVAVVAPVLAYLGLWWRRRAIGRDVPLLMVAFLPAAAVLLLTFDLGRPLDATAVLSVLGQSACNSVIHLVAAIGLSTVRVDPQPAPGWRVGVVAAVILAVVGAVIGHKQLGRAATAAVVALCLSLCLGVNWTDPTTGRLADAAAIFAVPVFVASIVGLLRPITDKWLTDPGPAVGVAFAILLALGVGTFVRAKAYRTDVSYWRDAVANEPRSAPFRARYAEALRLDAVTSGDASMVASAGDQADQALRLDPSNVAALRTKADTLVNGGDVKAAVPFFDRAVAIAPGDGMLRVDYGNALLRIGDRADARRQIVAAFGAFTSPPPLLHQLLGQIDLQDKRFGLAVTEFKTALDADPSDTASAEGMAAALTGRGLGDDVERAIGFYAGLLNDPVIQSSRPDLWESLGFAYQRLGRHDAAVIAFTGATQADRKIKKSPDQTSKKYAEELDAAKRIAATQPSTRPTTETTTRP